jgi:hypothetical protein
LSVASAVVAAEDPIRVSLSGTWMGTAPDGTEISYSFTPEGTVVWKVKEKNFARTFPEGLQAKYRIRVEKPHWEIDIYDFADARFKKSSFRGILAIDDPQTIKMDGRPSNQGERPRDFTPDAITLKCGVAAGSAADFKRYIEQLALTTSEKEQSSARQALEEAGMDAFPTLIAHFDDRTPAHTQRAITGKATIGEECFEILQYQIEGSWPKAYRSFQVLSPDNVKQWLAAHQGKTLAELRLISRQESLRRAQAKLAKDPSDDFWKEMVEFFREEVEKIQASMR